MMILFASFEDTDYSTLIIKLQPEAQPGNFYQHFVF